MIPRRIGTECYHFFTGSNGYASPLMLYLASCPPSQSLGFLSYRGGYQQDLGTLMQDIRGRSGRISARHAARILNPRTLLPQVVSIRDIMHNVYGRYLGAPYNVRCSAIFLAACTQSLIIICPRARSDPEIRHHAIYSMCLHPQ